MQRKNWLITSLLMIIIIILLLWNLIYQHKILHQIEEIQKQENFFQKEKKVIVKKEKKLVSFSRENQANINKPKEKKVTDNKPESEDDDIVIH